jgi:streptogramin lyase
MGKTHAAAAMAALLAGTLITIALASGSSDNGQAQRSPDAAGSNDLQAGYAARGQAWATELFGRRYGRHLLAAVISDTRDSEAIA